MIRALNPGLYSAGIDILASVLSAQGVPPAEIAKRAHLRIDEPERIRLHLGNLLFYAYDFSRGSDTKARFESAVARTKEANEADTEGVERFVVRGTAVLETSKSYLKDIGWYITQLPARG